MKYKKRAPGHKKLLNLFNDLLDAILTDKTSENQEVKKQKVEKQKVEKYKINMKIMKIKMKIIKMKIIKMKVMKKNEYEYEYKNKNHDDAIDQKKIIKGLNDNLDEIIDKSKSFEDQIKSLKGFWPYNDFGDKELKSKYFEIELADMSNAIDEKLFKQIFGHKLIKLADELINTKNKEENQRIVNDIHENKDKLYEMDEFNDWVIQPNSQRINLIDAINLILDFNETIQLGLT